MNNTPIDFFKSLFKNKKTTLTGNEVIALQYLHPEKGAINTGDYCTTQDIANLTFSGVANKPLVYKAILTQNWTNDPVATVLNSNDSNYLDIIWTRNGDGSYLGTYNGITNTNTIPHVSGAFADTFGYDVQVISNAVWITQYNGAVPTDGMLYLYVTIEYYGA